MSSIDEIIQAPGSEFDILKETIMKELHSAIPGIVQSFNADTQTASIKPAIRSRKDGKPVDVPLLTDVPVFFPGGASGYITYPISEGDECLVIFADGCVDGWFQNGGIANAVSMRKHDYSDAFAFVGFRSKPKKINNFPNAPYVFGFESANLITAQIAITSGYFTIPYTYIPAHKSVFVQNKHVTGYTTDQILYIITAEEVPSESYYKFYVRKPDGTMPEDGKIVDVDILIC